VLGGQREPEGMLFTRGAVYANAFPEREADQAPDEGALQGTGCAGGVVTAEARIVRDPSQEADVRGKILVPARQNDMKLTLCTVQQDQNRSLPGVTGAIVRATLHSGNRLHARLGC
jgi:hypothetical protein